MVETILQSEFVTQLVLPFLLMFTLVFAILEKTKILGDEKKQINAIVALVMGFIFITFSKYVGITTNILGIVAIAAVVLLVFMMLFAFASGEKDFKLPKGVRNTIWVLIALVLVISLLVFTGLWDLLVSSISAGSAIITNAVFIIIIAIAVIVVLIGAKKSS